MNKLKQIPEFLRFVMVGLFATGLHYGIYFVLQKFIQVNVAYTLGYVLSFVANFYLTAYFTFGSLLPGRKLLASGGTSDKLSDTYRIVESLSAVGFFPVRWLPSHVFLIAIPVNFLLVRFVFKQK